MSESGDSVASVSTVGSNYSVKAETAQMLGIPLHDGNFVEEGQEKSFVRSVYGVLVENWESWSTILRLIKARVITRQVRVRLAPFGCALLCDATHVRWMPDLCRSKSLS